jgi:hypothetical protein
LFVATAARLILWSFSGHLMGLGAVLGDPIAKFAPILAEFSTFSQNVVPRAFHCRAALDPDLVLIQESPAPGNID